MTPPLPGSVVLNTQQKQAIQNYTKLINQSKKEKRKRQQNSIKYQLYEQSPNIKQILNKIQTDNISNQPINTKKTLLAAYEYARNTSVDEDVDEQKMYQEKINAIKKSLNNSTITKKISNTVSSIFPRIRGQTGKGRNTLKKRKH